MEITAKLVKQLRDETGVQMMVCKEALKETDGNLEEAKLLLRKKGIEISGARDNKEANAGILYSYNHDNRVGVMIELRCETDFVAKNEEFHELAKIIAMHIAWAKPIAVDENGVEDDVYCREVRVAKSQIPEEKLKFATQILDGKMKKFFEKVCLLNQKELQVSEGQMTIGEMVKELSGKVGEKIEIRRFIRLEVGEEVGE